MVGELRLGDKAADVIAYSILSAIILVVAAFNASIILLVGVLLSHAIVGIISLNLFRYQYQFAGCFLNGSLIAAIYANDNSMIAFSYGGASLFCLAFIVMEIQSTNRRKSIKRDALNKRSRESRKDAH